MVCEEVNSLFKSSVCFFHRGASYFQSFIHSLAWMLCEMSCWEQWVQALLQFILTLFHATEAHSSGQSGQSRLKSDLHVCASKQIGINEEFNVLNISSTGATGEKKHYSHLSFCQENLCRAEDGRVMQIFLHPYMDGQKTSLRCVFDSTWLSVMWMGCQLHWIHQVYAPCPAHNGTELKSASGWWKEWNIRERERRWQTKPEIKHQGILD